MSTKNNKEIKFSDIQKEIGSTQANRLSDYYNMGLYVKSSKNIPACGKIGLKNFQNFTREEKCFLEVDQCIWKWGIGVWNYDIYSFGHKSNNAWFNVNELSLNFLTNIIGFKPTTITIQATGREVQLAVKTEEQSQAINLVNFGLNEGPGVVTFTEATQTFSFNINENGDFWIFSKLTNPSTKNAPVGGSIKLISAS
jgi:hypothetical protein